MNTINEYCPHPETVWIGYKYDENNKYVEVGFCVECGEEMTRFPYDETPCFNIGE